MMHSPEATEIHKKKAYQDINMGLKQTLFESTDLCKHVAL